MRRCARLGITMRRGVSLTILVIILAALLAPLAQGATAAVPVCCRVGGQHHCMGTAGMDGFRSQAQSCPFRSYPVVKGGIVALLGPNLPQARLATQPQFLVAALLEPVRLSFDTAQKRGPPQG
ncbi:MAG TPA: hypothetical protein VFB24_12895 [Candidatus Binatia bacterium]|nr:hypothetical protein [Candidatus Binatia bacterium]